MILIVFSQFGGSIVFGFPVPALKDYLRVARENQMQAIPSHLLVHSREIFSQTL